MMTSEVEISCRDSVKLNLLRETLNSDISLQFKLGGHTAEDYATEIRNEGSRMCVYGGLNLSEDPAGEVLSVRPASLGNSLKITFQYTVPPVGKSVSIFRKATRAVERAYDITDQLTSLELIPREDGQYQLKLTYAAPTDALPNTSHEPNAPTAVVSGDRETESSDTAIDELLERQSQLEQRRQDALEYRQKLERIEAEYDKDYSALQGDIEEMKERMKADAAVIEYYRDRDITPIETLMDEINAKLGEAEAQIRLFIEAKQRKTMAIENEIKSNQKK